MRVAVVAVLIVRAGWLELLSIESWLLVRAGTSSMLGIEPSCRRGTRTAEASRTESGWEERPPTLLIPQKGSSSRWLVADEGARGSAAGGVAVWFIFTASLSDQRLKAL